MLGKLTKSPSPTPGTQFQPPSQPSPQVQLQLQQQSSENSWTGRQQQPRLHNQSAYIENTVRHASQSLPPGAPGLQGRGSPPAISPDFPSKQLPQAMSQQQFLAQQSSTATVQPPRQSQQPQYESVPIPAGYGRLQGEYDAGQGQFFHQPTLQQGNRQEYSNLDPRQASIGRQSENRLSMDRRTISPDLSRQGTQASRTHETTRSLSPPISDGPSRSMTPASESGQFGRRQSLREGSLLGHQTPVRGPSIREGQGQDSQRYQQPLPLPQSIAQVQSGVNEYERSPSPRSVPLPISPPHLHPPFPPPPVQVRSEAPIGLVMETTESPPPPPPPKEEIRQSTPMNENMQKQKQTKPPNGSGSTENIDTSLPSAPPAMVLSLVPATGDTPPPPPTQKDEDMEKEAVDFSTEKIAVNLDLYGPGSKRNGNDSEDEYIMSPTAYPGQAWEPSYYGWS